MSGALVSPTYGLQAGISAQPYGLRFSRTLVMVVLVIIYHLACLCKGIEACRLPTFE